MTALAQRRDDTVRRFEPEIGANERVIDLIERCSVELALGDEVRDRAQRRGTALEAAGQPMPPLALSFGGFSGFRCTIGWTVLHRAPVIAVSA